MLQPRRKVFGKNEPPLFQPTADSSNKFAWNSTNTEVIPRVSTMSNKDLAPVTVSDARPKRLAAETIRPFLKEPQLFPEGKGVPTNITAKPIDLTPAGKSTNATKSSGFSKAVSDVVPYVSNIANSLKRVPLPDAPGMINPVARRQVNYDSQRVEADRQMRGANVNADRNLDENTAAAYKGSTLASNIRSRNSIAEAEANTNAQLGMQTDQMNANIEAQNVGMMNQWKNNLVEAQVAGQREQSANLSNAADKYITQQNVKGQRNLDMKRLGVYKGMFENSGVMDRRVDGYQRYLEENGLTDDVISPKKVGRYGGTMLKYGGRMKVY